MKRLLLMSALSLAALLLGAQTKISPTMKKGMKKTYVTQATASVPSKQPVTITCETVFEVTDETSDGYTLDVLVTDVTSDAKNAEGRAYSLATEMLKGTHMLYATDKDGKVVSVLDLEGVTKQTEGVIDEMLNDVTLPNQTTASDLRKQLTAGLNEESLLESVRMSTSPLALNGKTISTDTTEEYTTQQGIKMKRTYTVKDNNSIQSSAKIDMSSEDIKQMLVGMLGKTSVGFTGEALKGLESMIAGFKIDASEDTDYTLAEDGWVKSITSETTTKGMGVTIQMKTTVTQK